MSDTYEGLMKIQSAIGTPEEDCVLKDTFPGFISDSIDYGIMEKASGIYLIPGNFGWDDVGSWLAVERVKGIDTAANTLTEMYSLLIQNIVPLRQRTPDCCLGLKNLIIVDTDDALLIADKNSAGDIKKLLSVLRETNREKYL